MTITRWQKPELATRSAFNRLFSLRDEIDRIFESPWSELSRASHFLNGWAPAVDVYENNDSVIVRAEVSGMKKEDINVTLHDGALNIAGERKADGAHAGGAAHRAERYFGRFQRSVALPAKVAADKIHASYKDGVLTVTLPKSEEAKPKQIAVSVS